MIDFAFLDSGTGGLPYLKCLKEKSPNSCCIYVGDTKNFPYGEKTKDQIIENSANCIKKIIEKWNPNVIVIACNTISVTALEEFRKRFPTKPFVGTVPAIKPASLISKTRKIGLLATNATVNHPYTKNLQKEFASDCQMISRGDPDLISFIEHKFFNASEEERFAAVKPAVDFFRNAGCDVIVLACTHFLNMAGYIQKYAGDDIAVVDSRNGVARHAIDIENLFYGKKDNLISKKVDDDSELVVTGFSSSNDSRTYENFCLKNNIRFGGIFY